MDVQHNEIIVRTELKCFFKYRSIFKIDSLILLVDDLSFLEYYLDNVIQARQFTRVICQALHTSPANS